MVEGLIAFGFLTVCVVVGRVVNQFDPGTKLDEVLTHYPWVDVTYPPLDSEYTVH